MKLLVWNIRELAKNPSIRRLKKIIKSKSTSVIAIFEPKVTVGNIRDFEFRLNCVGSFANSENNIWLFWKSCVTCNIIHSTEQYISAMLNIGGIDVIIFFVYASCDANIRQSLWDTSILLTAQIHGW